MKQIGEYSELSGDTTLEQFIDTAAPRGYLLHYNALGTLNPRGGTQPGATMYRLAQADQQASPTGGDDRGQAYTVFAIESSKDAEATQFLVGCGDRCDIMINEASISREHAVILYADGKCQIRDNGSTAGSLVNDQPLASGEDWPLVSGSRVTLGTVSLQFLAPTEFYNFVRRFLA